MALVVAATADISSTTTYLESKEYHDARYRSNMARVEALRSVLKKMDERVTAVIREDVDKKYEYMKG